MRKLTFIVTGFICITLLGGCQTSQTTTEQSNAMTSENVESVKEAPEQVPKDETKDENTIPDEVVTTENESSETNDDVTVNQEKELNLYLYGPDDYENPVEIKQICVAYDLYETNLTEALNQLFAETDIQIQDALIDTSECCITVDLSQEVADRFNQGSCTGVIMTNELIDTLVHLPDVDSAIVTVEGVTDTYADHYSFEGVFEREQ